MAKHGTLYMIPCPIVDHKNDSIPSETIAAAHSLTHFVVERARTARRWLSSTDHPSPIDELHIFELDKNDSNQDLAPFLQCLLRGISVGVISEAGCPGIADPGHRVVRYAYRNGITVRPMVGPNSILMALMASGFQGQSFSFHGYLPAKKPDLPRKLKQLESMMLSTGQTQLFMEAPYRNSFLLEQICQSLSASTLLSVACDVNSSSEHIFTQPIKHWQKTDFKKYHKRPTIFSIGRY